MKLAYAATMAKSSWMSRKKRKQWENKKSTSNLTITVITLMINGSLKKLMALEM